MSTFITQMGKFSFFHVSLGEGSPFSHTPRSLPHLSNPVSVLSTHSAYIWRQLQIKGADEKSLYFVKLHSQSFSDIIDYIIQIILNS